MLYDLGSTNTPRSIDALFPSPSMPFLVPIVLVLICVYIRYRFLFYHYSGLILMDTLESAYKLELHPVFLNMVQSDTFSSYSWLAEECEPQTWLATRLSSYGFP